MLTWNWCHILCLSSFQPARLCLTENTRMPLSTIFWEEPKALKTGIFAASGNGQDLAQERQASWEIFWPDQAKFVHLLQEIDPLFAPQLDSYHVPLENGKEEIKRLPPTEYLDLQPRVKVRKKAHTASHKLHNAKYSWRDLFTVGLPIKFIAKMRR